MEYNRIKLMSVLLLSIFLISEVGAMTCYADLVPQPVAEYDSHKVYKDDNIYIKQLAHKKSYKLEKLRIETYGASQVNYDHEYRMKQLEYAHEEAMKKLEIEAAK